jgi:hypothetical protein
MSSPPGPPRRRKCASCGETFASPAILLQHKTLNGDCRPVTSLVAFGLTYRKGAWEWAPGKLPPKGRMKV